MSSEFHAYILKDAREYRAEDGRAYPVIPDLADPILSVPYVMEAWAQSIGKNARVAANKRADELGIVCCHIKQFKMIRFSDVAKFLAE